MYTSSRNNIPCMCARVCECGIVSNVQPQSKLIIHTMMVGEKKYITNETYISDSIIIAQYAQYPRYSILLLSNEYNLTLPLIC